MNRSQSKMFVPVASPPGSTAKVDAMVLRYERGLPLFHPDDARYSEPDKVPQWRAPVPGIVAPPRELIPDFDEDEFDTITPDLEME